MTSAKAEGRTYHLVVLGQHLAHSPPRLSGAAVKESPYVRRKSASPLGTA